MCSWAIIGPAFIEIFLGHIKQHMEGKYIPQFESALQTTEVEGVIE